MTPDEIRAEMTADVESIKRMTPKEQLESITDGDKTIYYFVKDWDSIPDTWIEDVADRLMLDDVELLTARQCYGAKLQTAFSRDKGLPYEFRTYENPGRGRFKCTLIGEHKNLS